MQNAFGAKVKLVPGRGGIFNVIVDGKPVFSKSNAGRFPNPGEVAGKIEK